MVDNNDGPTYHFAHTHVYVAPALERTKRHRVVVTTHKRHKQITIHPFPFIQWVWKRTTSLHIQVPSDWQRPAMLSGIVLVAAYETNVYVIFMALAGKSRNNCEQNDNMFEQAPVKGETLKWEKNRRKRLSNRTKIRNRSFPWHQRKKMLFLPRRIRFLRPHNIRQYRIRHVSMCGLHSGIHVADVNGGIRSVGAPQRYWFLRCRRASNVFHSMACFVVLLM